MQRTSKVLTKTRRIPSGGRVSRIGGLTSPSIARFAGGADIGHFYAEVDCVEEEDEAVEVEAAAMSVFSLEINASSLLAL